MLQFSFVPVVDVFDRSICCILCWPAKIRASVFVLKNCLPLYYKEKSQEHERNTFLCDAASIPEIIFKAVVDGFFTRYFILNCFSGKPFFSVISSIFLAMGPSE